MTEDDSGAIEAIREGIREAEDGRVYPARESLEELGKKLGISIKELADEALREQRAGRTVPLEEFLDL
jgi:predicted transcriptional regulator